MAEKTDDAQVSEVKDDKKSSEVFKTAIKMVIAIILFGIGVWAIIGWWRELWTVFKGCIGLFLILAGIITFAIAKE